MEVTELAATLFVAIIAGAVLWFAWVKALEFRESAVRNGFSSLETAFNFLWFLASFYCGISLVVKMYRMGVLF